MPMLQGDRHWGQELLYQVGLVRPEEARVLSCHFEDTQPRLAPNQRGTKHASVKWRRAGGGISVVRVEELSKFHGTAVRPFLPRHRSSVKAVHDAGPQQN